MRGAILIPIAAIFLTCELPSLGSASGGPSAVLLIEGRITHSESGDPIQGARVDIVTLRGGLLFCGVGDHCSVVGSIFGVNHPLTDVMGGFALAATTKVFCRDDFDYYFDVTADGYQRLETAPGSIQCVSTTQTFSLQLTPL